jgi:hypothetical protein
MIHHDLSNFPHFFFSSCSHCTSEHFSCSLYQILQVSQAINSSLNRINHQPMCGLICQQNLRCRLEEVMRILSNQEFGIPKIVLSQLKPSLNPECPHCRFQFSLGSFELVCTEREILPLASLLLGQECDGELVLSKVWH